jgi:hypothetical protein
MDFDHVLRSPDPLALKTPRGFVSPVGRGKMVTWTDAAWIEGRPGTPAPTGRKGGSVLRNGKPLDVGVDPTGRVIVYRV